MRSRPGTETILRLPLRDAGRGSTRRNTSRATDQSINPARSACGTQQLRKIRCRSFDSHHPGVLRPARTAPVRAAFDAWADRRQETRSSPNTETSSSTSGQWIPSPRPISRQCVRCVGVASSNRGNHTRGTDSSRPSARTTWSHIRHRNINCRRVHSYCRSAHPTPPETPACARLRSSAAGSAHATGSGWMTPVLPVPTSTWPAYHHVRHGHAAARDPRANRKRSETPPRAALSASAPIRGRSVNEP